jgi:hypothetical protein
MAPRSGGAEPVEVVDSGRRLAAPVGVFAQLGQSPPGSVSRPQRVHALRITITLKRTDWGLVDP